MQDFIEGKEINITKETDLNNQESLQDNKLITNRVKEIRALMSNLHTELEELISSCNHPDGYVIKLVNDRTGNNAGLRRVCEICDSAVGYPSQTEIDDWREN